MTSPRWREAALLPIVVSAWIAATAPSIAADTNAPPPALKPIQLRFAADGPRPATNLVAITLHEPPALALAQPEASRKSDLDATSGPWMRSEAPPPGTMADIAPPDPATTRAPGWLAEDLENAGDSGALGERGQSRRGWLANSVNRLQARAASAAEEAEADASLWDDQRDDDTRLDGDLWQAQDARTENRSWVPNRTVTDNSGAWDETFARPTGATEWRNETDPLSSRSGEGNAMRPAFGPSDDKR